MPFYKKLRLNDYFAGSTLALEQTLANMEHVDIAAYQKTLKAQTENYVSALNNHINNSMRVSANLELFQAGAPFVLLRVDDYCRSLGIDAETLANAMLVSHKVSVLPVYGTPYGIFTADQFIRVTVGDMYGICRLIEFFKDVDQNGLNVNLK